MPGKASKAASSRLLYERRRRTAVISCLQSTIKRNAQAARYGKVFALPHRGSEVRAFKAGRGTPGLTNRQLSFRHCIRLARLEALYSHKQAQQADAPRKHVDDNNPLAFRAEF